MPAPPGAQGSLAPRATAISPQRRLASSRPYSTLLNLLNALKRQIDPGLAPEDLYSDRGDLALLIQLDNRPGEVRKRTIDDLHDFAHLELDLDLGADGLGRLEQAPVSWETLLAGFRYVWQNKIILGAITLDLFAVLLGGAVALLPIYAKEILRMREILNKILADATGQPIERIARDVDRDYIMEAEQALEYGMVDKIIARREK